MKIVFYDIEGWELAAIQKQLSGHQLRFYHENFSDTHLPDADAEIISMFTNSPVTEKVLKHCPDLKFVVTRSTGYDHINLESCRQQEVSASNVPTYGANTVAEFAFALILTLSRKIYPALKRVREEAKFESNGLRGFDLKDKILGVVGMGHIGSFVVKIAAGFGMQVLAFDPHPNQQLAKDLNFSYLALEDLLKQSDIVTLHVPYMPATHHLINQDNFKLFKKGSILINTARGGLVDTTALVEALKSGILAGAGLDVLEEEGFISEELEIITHGHPNAQQLKTVLVDHELMHMDNVIITPHNAFNTQEAVQRILNTTIENILGFLNKQPVNVIK